MTSIIPTIQPSIFPSIEGSILSPFGASSLMLDFARNAYSMGAIGSVPSDRTFANLITFSRASGGGRVNPAGQLEWVGNDVPRFTYDPVTLQPLGLLIEERRTNLLLQSAVLATQNVTVTAVAHTLSFYGTGTVTLSGVATGSKTGAGAYPALSTLTFTPTAGTLTLTVTGSVTFGQLEAGAFNTSYIPTTTAQVARAADFTAINTLSPWYSASEWSIVVKAINSTSSPAVNTPVFIFDGAGTNLVRMRDDPTSLNADIFVNGSNQVQISVNRTILAGVPFMAALSVKVGAVSISRNGSAPVNSSSLLAMPLVSVLQFGYQGYNSNRFNGIISSFGYYPKIISVQQASA